MKTRLLIIVSALVLIPANSFAQDGAYELDKPLCTGGRNMVLDENCMRIHPSPYSQQQDGIEPKDVRCNHDLYRGYRTSDGTAFCASGYSLNQLIYREYAEPFDSINAATVSGKNYVVNGYCPASSELLQYGWYPYDNPTDIILSNIDLNYDPEEDSRSVEFTFDKMNEGAAMVWVFVECGEPKSNPEPEPTSTDQQNLLDARDKLREAYHTNVSWGSFNIKDAIVGYGIGDGFLVVDILEEYYNSDEYHALTTQKIIDITDGKVDIEFNSSKATVPTNVESVFPYVWNGFLHRNGIEFTPKEQSYANNDIGYDGIHRVCSPIIASNGTELYVSSVFVYEPFEITGTYIDKIKPDDCYKIWKTYNTCRA